MKLSTTLDQLLRLVLVPEEGENRRDDPALSVTSPESWRARYSPVPPAEAEPEAALVSERRPVDPQPAPWEAQFTREEPVEPTYDEPESVRYEPAESEPEAEPWQSRFIPPEPLVPQPQSDSEPAPILPPQPTITTEPSEEPRTSALEHKPATERSRLEQLEAAVTVAESLNLGLHLALAVERIAMAAAQGREGVGPLKEAAWLIERYISLLEKRPIGADLHQSAARLARTGGAIQDLKQLASSLRSDPDPDEPGRIRRLSD